MFGELAVDVQQQYFQLWERPIQHLQHGDVLRSRVQGAQLITTNRRSQTHSLDADRLLETQLHHTDLGEVLVRRAAQEGLLNRHAMGAHGAAYVALVNHAAAALGNLPSTREVGVAGPIHDICATQWLGS